MDSSQPRPSRFNPLTFMFIIFYSIQRAVYIQATNHPGRSYTVQTHSFLLFRLIQTLVYIYYIEREAYKERERGTERERERICEYKYRYIEIERKRERERPRQRERKRERESKIERERER